MYTLLIILFVLVCFSMVVVILLQAGKGQGLAGTDRALGVQDHVGAGRERKQDRDHREAEMSFHWVTPGLGG